MPPCSVEGWGLSKWTSTVPYNSLPSCLGDACDRGPEEQAGCGPAIKDALKQANKWMGGNLCCRADLIPGIL